MQKCPKCQVEYSDEEKSCPLCSVSTNIKPEKIEWVVLTTASNDIEYEMIAALLKMAEIPSVGRTRNFNSLDGGFMHVILGAGLPVEIRVPEDRLDEALQLLNAQIEDNPDVGPEKEKDE